MDVINAIEARRSVRAYTDRKLTKSEIEEIIRAGTLAPSACNMQSWYFYIVADASEREKLKAVCADWISTAPVVFIVCTDENGIVSRFGSHAKKFPMQDTSLAMENMLLKATEMGFGGCIIGAYKQNELVELFNLPKEHTPVALLPIGEPKNEIPPRDRKSVAEVSSYIGAIPDWEEMPRKEEPAGQYKLKHAYFGHAEFEDLGLPEASFDNVSLEKAKFNNINLSGAVFTDINLSGANYSALNMSGSSFECAEINGARFGCCEKCEKEGKYCVEMKKSLFDSVDMSDSQMNHCKLENAVLTDVRAVRSKLYDIDFDWSDLSGVNLVESKIRCTNLYGAAIENSCFANARLSSCDIDGMTVDGVNVKEAIEFFRNERQK